MVPICQLLMEMHFFTDFVMCDFSVADMPWVVVYVIFILVL